MGKLKELSNTLIRWAERKTRLNLRHHLKGWAWLMSGQVVGTLSALLLALGYAHFIPKEVYGTYKYILSVLGILAVFTLPGMGDAASRAIAQGKDGPFWPTFYARLRFGTIGAVISALVGIYYFTLGNSLLGAIFCAVAPFLVFSESFSHYQALLLGRQLFRTYSISGVILQLAASVSIFLVVITTDNIFIIVLAYFAIFTILRGLLLLYVIRKYPLNGLPDTGALRYGGHMSIANILNAGSGQLDIILLWHFLGPIPLAIYAFAQAASDQARKAFKLVTTAMAFPKLASLETQFIKRELPHKILLAHGITIPLAILLAGIVPYVYTLLFPTYTESIPYAQVMMLLLAFSPIRLISTAINAKGSIRDIYLMNVSGSVLQTILLLILIPSFGLWGAILATPLQSLISNILFIRIFRSL